MIENPADRRDAAALLRVVERLAPHQAATHDELQRAIAPMQQLHLATLKTKSFLERARGPILRGDETGVHQMQDDLNTGCTRVHSASS